MSNDALLREAARCRRLAEQTIDVKLQAMLQAIAWEYESRAFEPRAAEPVSEDTAAALRRIA